jgi:phosphorylated CTD-interacting factor 1
MQGAIHEQVFEALQSNIRGTWLEGFASPFNVRLSSFGSAFPDIEWHFGSVGNFLDHSFQQGACCEANPPFSPGIMTEMAVHMQKQLELANENEIPLTFAVVVPTAAEDEGGSAVAKKAAAASYQEMLSSSNLRIHVKLAAREHGYLEGAQHLKPTKYKQSSYDTSIIVLQSDKAFADCSDLKKLERDLRKAFASRHKE